MVNQDTQRGIILIDSILQKQYKALRNYNPIYQSGEKAITFEATPVNMTLRQNDISLETVTAANSLVQENNKQNHLHILYFNGNSGCYQQDYKKIAEDLLSYERKGAAATGVQFNYPGILNSEGQVEIAQDLIDAGIAQVKSLLDQGIPHSKIVLHGVSLGGSIASHVAAYFHKLPKDDDPKQRQTLGGIYASRTFASTAQVGRNFFNRALGDNIFSHILSTVCLPFIKLGTWGSEWDLDTGRAFFSLPRNKRNYSVVLSPDANRKEYQRQQSRSFFQKIVDFILRREINPADDAILRRGLHDSWEKTFDAFLVKIGYYGDDEKRDYAVKNSYRKMMVVDFKTKKLAPGVDGHAKAHYCYKREGGYINPNKEHKTIGLVHRTPSISIFKKGKNFPALSVSGNEAGEVARNSMFSMSES